MRFVGVALLAACGGKSDDPPVAGSAATPGGSSVAIPTKPAAGFEKLTATVDGKPVAMQRGFIKWVSPDHWRILVGDIEGSCEELLSGTVNRQGGHSFVASLARRIAPDGSEAIAVTDFWSAGRPTKATFAGAVTVTGSTDKGKTSDVVLPKITVADEALVVSGGFAATGCGDQPAPDPGSGGIPKVDHPSTGMMTIAGHKLEIRGAILRGSDIVLSAGPKDCSQATPLAPVVLRHDSGVWELSGTWIAGAKTADDKSKTMKGTSFKVGAQGTSADGATAAVLLGGKGAIGGYAIELSGTVEALDCPEEK